MHVKAHCCLALCEISLNGNNDHGEQDGSHHGIFKFLTNAKCTVFMLPDTVANTVIKYEKMSKKDLARLPKNAVTTSPDDIK